MTNEQAIKIIKGRNFRCVECIDRSEECCEALDMAIQSLEYTDCDLINRDALLEKMWSDFYKLQEEHEKEQGYEYIGTKRCLEQNGFECALKTVINFPKSEQTDGDLISKSVLDQIKWERDVAISQLHDLGYELGEKPRTDGDLISRQAVIDLLNRLIEVERKQGTDVMNYGRERVNAYESILYEIESDYLFPSMSSAEKTAEWKPLDKEKAQYYMFGYVCSKCGAPAKSPTKYCPNCGRRMKEGDTE